MSFSSSRVMECVASFLFTESRTDCESFRSLVEQLWDVTEDQEAVNLVRDKPDAQQMAKLLLEHALVRFSSDNVTVMVVRFKPVAGSS